MSEKITDFLKTGRNHAAMKRPVAVTGSHQAGVSPQKKTPNNPVDLPAPAQAVDLRLIRLLASTQQSAQMERRAEVRRSHYRTAKTSFREFIAAQQGRLEGLNKRLVEVQARLKNVRGEKKQFRRFGKPKKARARRNADAADSKKPRTRWIQALFFAVILVMLIAILNGTFTVSSVMLDNTAFAGSYAKTVTIALGLFLLPGLGLSIPFHLLKSRPRLASAYLAVLVIAGISFGFFFALTWAHTYAVETGNETLIELTSIGMGSSETDTVAVKPYLFENANWLSLLFQILADICFAGAAKSYLTYLSWNYHLFRTHALQEDPEWLNLDREERQLTETLADIEGEKKQAIEHLAELEEERDAYVESVCSYANALFEQEMDRFEQQHRRLREKQEELRQKESALRQSRQEMDDLLTQNPGLLRRDHDDDHNTQLTLDFPERKQRHA